MSTVHLQGAGDNKYWNIPRALETLQGLQCSLLLLVQELDRNLGQRDSRAGKPSQLFGVAVSVIVLAAYAVEIALKTLHAQSNPSKKPPRGHDLLDLYCRLEKSVRQELEEEYLGMESLGGWDTKLTIRATLGMGQSNFEDWRYCFEKDVVGNGIPKPLIDIVWVIRKVCLKKLSL